MSPADGAARITSQLLHMRMREGLQATEKSSASMHDEGQHLLSTSHRANCSALIIRLCSRCQAEVQTRMQSQLPFSPLL